MLKRHKNRKRKSKYYSLIVFLAGLTICLFDIRERFYNEKLNNKKVNEFIKNNSIEKELINNNKIKYSNSEEKYIGVLEIQKLKLKKGFYNLDSINNNVSKGIEIIEKSDMPDIRNGTLILASHSGNGQVSYFKNLNKLLPGDITYIYYNKHKYKYKLIDIYEIEKNGILELNKNNNISTLILITCSKDDDTKQIVYVNRLITVL